MHKSYCDGRSDNYGTACDEEVEKMQKFMTWLRILGEKLVKTLNLQNHMYLQTFVRDEARSRRVDNLLNLLGPGIHHLHQPLHEGLGDHTAERHQQDGSQDLPLQNQ